MKARRGWPVVMKAWGGYCCVVKVSSCQSVIVNVRSCFMGGHTQVFRSRESCLRFSFKYLPKEHRMQSR